MASRSENESGAVGERVKAAVGTVQEKARDVLEPAVDKARGKVGDFQASVADAAESGAEAIRSRGRATVPRRVAVAGGAVAERLEGTAYWLRENDLTDLVAVVRRELRTSPGRIALLALGIGFLLGRASRR